MFVLSLFLISGNIGTEVELEMYGIWRIGEDEEDTRRGTAQVREQTS